MAQTVFPPKDFPVSPAEILLRAAQRRNAWVSFAPLEMRYRDDLGIRLIPGKRIDLYTDLPATPANESILPTLEAALDTIYAEFDIKPANQLDKKIEAFLMGDKEPFEIFGAFDKAPSFENGYALCHRIWVFDKNQDYYNRFLLIHELVHAVMDALFGNLSPRWYSEGIAERLALHRGNPSSLEMGIFPVTPDEVPGFGRIDRIRREVQAGKIKTPDEILRFDAHNYDDPGTYAWSWAWVTFLSHHPKSRDAMRFMPYLMTTPNANNVFWKMLGDNASAIRIDWPDFLRSLDYGDRIFVPVHDNRVGQAFEGEEELSYSANHPGWINTGIRLDAEAAYRITAAGEYRVFDPQRLLPCRPNGITLRYYNGRPLGQLLATVVSDAALLGRKKPSPNDSPFFPWDPIEPVAPNANISPTESGTLYLRLNLPPLEAERADGTFTVRIRRE